jgi:hypothetical protein
MSSLVDFLLVAVGVYAIFQIEKRLDDINTTLKKLMEDAD